MRDALHQTAVAREHVGVVIDDGVARTIESRCEILFRQRHPDRVGESLTERTSRGFDTHRYFVFGMSCSSRAELPEVTQLIELDRIAGEI